MAKRANRQELPQWAGGGLAEQTFRCARCDAFRRLLGRRGRMVKGSMQWVCALCIAAEKGSPPS